MIHEIDDWFPSNVESTSDAFARTSARVLPWQYRSVIEWWPEFDCDENESAALVDLVRASGKPGLEVGCGSGRRLLACWNAGLDVNGTESPGALLALCRERTAHAGVGIFAQRFHELDLPRRYRSIYVRRDFGASEHAKCDEAALVRLYRMLEPGGVLVLQQPAASDEKLSWWGRLRGDSPEPPQLPSIELRAAVSKTAPETGTLELWSRPLSFCSERRLLRFTVRAEQFVRGERKASRGVALCQRFPTREQTLRMLCEAGFERRRIHEWSSKPGALRCWVAEKSTPGSKRRQIPLGPIGLAAVLRSKS